MNIDESASTKEKLFVTAFFSKEFGKEKSTAYMKRIEVLLNSNYSIDKILNLIDYKEAEPAKVQLLNFLIKITIVDSYLTNQEYRVLLKICKGLSMPIVRLTSMLAMYDYVHEQQAKNDQRDRRKIKTNSSASKLDMAYKVLELKSTATDKAIKKSYRKLVTLYHPDKIEHLSVKHKISAKEKYQKINEAYDLLKSYRKFK
jgi:DnaJ like chaperone protein